MLYRELHSIDYAGLSLDLFMLEEDTESLTLRTAPPTKDELLLSLTYFPRPENRWLAILRSLPELFHTCEQERLDLKHLIFSKPTKFASLVSDFENLGLILTSQDHFENTYTPEELLQADIAAYHRAAMQAYASHFWPARVQHETLRWVVYDVHPMRSISGIELDLKTGLLSKEIFK